MNFECKATMQKEEKQLQLDVIFFSFHQIIIIIIITIKKNVCTVYKTKEFYLRSTSQCPTWGGPKPG